MFVLRRTPEANFSEPEPAMVSPDTWVMAESGNTLSAGFGLLPSKSSKSTCTYRVRFETVAEVCAACPNPGTPDARYDITTNPSQCGKVGSIVCLSLPKPRKARHIRDVSYSTAMSVSTRFLQNQRWHHDFLQILQIDSGKHIPLLEKEGWMRGQ